MSRPFGLFSVYGVELEYMLVDCKTLNVAPIADQLMWREAGQNTGELTRGAMAWSNELALHLIELKTNGPSQNLESLPALFQAEINHINDIFHGEFQLLPTAAHPWMEPTKETKLWPFDNDVIYQAYDRIFNCRGHGWSNLQSAHLNLPFANDHELMQLHTAIRSLLPIIPALSASSPFIEKKLTGTMDTRLVYYMANQDIIPEISGHIIPEYIESEYEYQQKILQPMYQAVAKHDSDQVLQEEWLNSRGAIARFDRHAVEIRVLDIQECPLADLAVHAAIVNVLKTIIAEKWLPIQAHKNLTEQMLKNIFVTMVRDGQMGIITDKAYLQLFGYAGHKATAKELWQYLLAESAPLPLLFQEPIHTIFKYGTLAERIVSLQKKLNNLKSVYQQLANCLKHGALFIPS